VLAADEAPGDFPVQEAFLSDSKQHVGFSFHISETPPPVGARAGTPLADLELDLGEFGAEPVPEAESPATPAIKKIRFPRSAPAKSEVSPQRSVSHPTAEKTPSPTRFSKSIGAADLRVQLDSEPEMALPEDLPEDQDLVPPGEQAIGWTTDTPHAREIWRRARSTWKHASQRAASLGEHGIRASKALAESVGEKVREKMRDSSDEKKRRQAEPSTPTALPKMDPLEPDHLEPDHLEPGTGPSVASRVILGLARTAARKSAAPLSALAAATIVYLAGSYFLGSNEPVALSKNTNATDVPELGTLAHSKNKEPESANSDVTADDVKGSEKRLSQGPPAMEIEITPMPQGMSWPGKGLIEVVTSAEELVYVDGVFTGRGPLRRIPVSPGPHEISIRADGKERTGTAQVEAGRATRAVFKAE
jgi:hypothetical protein